MQFVKREEREKLAEDYDTCFFETSAKENESIEEDFGCIAKKSWKTLYQSGVPEKEQEKPTKQMIQAANEIGRKNRKKYSKCF